MLLELEDHLYNIERAMESILGLEELKLSWLSSIISTVHLLYNFQKTLDCRVIQVEHTMNTIKNLQHMRVSDPGQ